jgi:hypothetical protein
LPNPSSVLLPTTVKDQGNLPACAACAVTTAVEAVLPGFVGDFVSLFDRIALTPESLNLEAALEAARRFGIQPEARPKKRGRNARHVRGWVRAVNPEACCQWLARRVALAAAFDIHVFDKLGLWKPPANSASGHCAAVIGYDADAKCLVFRNSYGRGWGEGGDFKVPWEMAGDTDLFHAYYAVLVRK